jgi:hypothetical protein
MIIFWISAVPSPPMGTRHETYGPSLAADQACIASQNTHHGRSV